MASSSTPWPLTWASRPTDRSRSRRGSAPSRERTLYASGSMPQCTTWSLAQWSSGTNAITWLRPKSLMQTAKSALRTLAGSASFLTS